jgi:hypothetical protein
MAHSGIAPLNAEVHLKRALGFIEEVEKATEEFRNQAVAHDARIDAQIESDAPFLTTMVSTIRGKRQLAQNKTSLWNDLQLAEQEINRAVAVNSDAAINTKIGTVGAPQLRAWIMYSRGQIEMIWGSADAAIQLFNQCLQIIDFAEPHYMLGLLFEAKYMPAPALWHFEKCLQLDPAGDLSVSALREANAMRNYKKRFRGSWGVFFLLLFIWPAAIIYFFVKRK